MIADLGIIPMKQLVPFSKMQAHATLKALFEQACVSAILDDMTNEVLMVRLLRPPEQHHVPPSPSACDTVSQSPKSSRECSDSEFEGTY